MYLVTAVVVSLIGAACAKPIKSIKRQVIDDTYDFIIAGGRSFKQ